MPAHTIYIVDILLITVLNKFTVLHENLISGVFACFVGVFARKKNRIKKRRTSPTEHFFWTWIVHQDLIRIPQNMDKITFRLSFQFPPQADFWGQAEIQALWMIQDIYIYIRVNTAVTFEQTNAKELRSHLERVALNTALIWDYFNAC